MYTPYSPGAVRGRPAATQQRPPNSVMNSRRRMSASRLTGEMHRSESNECFERGWKQLRYCNMRCWPMSASGHRYRLIQRQYPTMSAPSPIATVPAESRSRCAVISDIRAASKRVIRRPRSRGRATSASRKPDRLGGRQVNHEIELGRLLDWTFARLLGTLQGFCRHNRRRGGTGLDNLVHRTSNFPLRNPSRFRSSAAAQRWPRC